MINLQQSLNEDIRCELANHFLDKVQYVCIFDKCASDQRLCCSYCKFKYHNQHIQSLIKINDFTHKVQKEGEFLNIKLQEKGQKGQLNQLYEQKILKKINDEIQFANMQIQGIFNEIHSEVSANIQNINNSIDERALGQSVNDLQTKIQRIINRPWNAQSNEAIDLMVKIYRGDKYGELLEDDYFISHKNIQSMNTYFSQVHAKLQTFFISMYDQVPFIFRDGFSNNFDRSSGDLGINTRKQERDTIFPQIRSGSMRRDQNGFDSNNTTNGYQQSYQLPNTGKPYISTQRSRSKRDLENQNNSMELDNRTGFNEAYQPNRLNYQRNMNSFGNIYNSNQKPQSILFKQYDSNQILQNRNNSTRMSQDSLDTFAQYKTQNSRFQNNGYQPFNEEDMNINQEDLYIHYSKALKQNRGMSARKRSQERNIPQHNLGKKGQEQFNSNAYDSNGNQNNTNNEDNLNKNSNQYYKKQFEGQQNMNRSTIQDGRNNLNNSFEFGSPKRENSHKSKGHQQNINQNILGSLSEIQNEQESPQSSTEKLKNTPQMMSIILPSENIKASIPQGSKIHIQNEAEKQQQQSHLQKPPQPLNFDHCRQKVNESPIDFIEQQIETDQLKIKFNMPQNNWIPSQTQSKDLPHYELLCESQQKYGYLDIADTKSDQSRLGLYKLENENTYYEGEWMKGKRHGKGTLYMDDGSIYQGEWDDDEMTGRGRLIKIDGDIYEGDFLNEIFEGQGYLRYQNGAEFIGTLKNNQFEGQGRKQWPNGAYYEGHFSKNQRDGQGVFVWKNGSFYQGSFKNNQFNGKGIYQWQSGRLYDGEWKDGKMNGKGKDILEQGYIYEGQFQNDQKHGYGVFTFNENKQYKGHWENDQPHGEGVMIENGQEKKGIWDNGKLIKRH